MPTAEQMLQASKAAIRAARGSGNAGLDVIAHLGPQVKALTDLVVRDMAPKPAPRVPFHQRRAA